MAEKPEELSLPLASVNKVINDALPSKVNVSSETRKTIAKAASVFVLYTTATAASMAQKAGRKTMNATDVLDALDEIEYPQFKSDLETLLAGYRQAQQKKKETSTARKSDKNKSNNTKNQNQDEGGVPEGPPPQVVDISSDSE